MQTKTVLTKMEAATQRAISVQTLDKMFKRGDLPRVQLTTRRVGVVQSDLNEYLENRRVVKDAETETPQHLNNAEAAVTGIKFNLVEAFPNACHVNQ